jgi:hypothetical protein
MNRTIDGIFIILMMNVDCKDGGLYWDIKMRACARAS